MASKSWGSLNKEDCRPLKIDIHAGWSEAPASCNVYVDVAGRKVQVTLRDSDEARMLARLTALLTQFPTEQEASEPPEGRCGMHNVQVKHHTHATGSWWSHKTADGWFHGK